MNSIWTVGNTLETLVRWLNQPMARERRLDTGSALTKILGPSSWNYRFYSVFCSGMYIFVFSKNQPRLYLEDKNRFEQQGNLRVDK